MKNTLKALLIIAGLTQGTVVFAESSKQVNFSWDPHTQPGYKATVNGMQCYPTDGNFTCRITKDRFVGAKFVVTKGNENCIFEGTKEGLKEPTSPCAFVINVNRNDPENITVSLK